MGLTGFDRLLCRKRGGSSSTDAKQNKTKVNANDSNYALAA